MHGASHEDGETTQSYFIPMVDMLAGVVFILVILLASVTLVSRDDFASSQLAQEEVARIEAELQAARAAERVYLEPRRQADAAMRMLLQRIRERLAAADFEVMADTSAGTLTIAAAALFAKDGTTLTGRGAALAEALGAILVSEVPCLPLAGSTRPAGCAPYPDARLERITLAVTAPAPAAAVPAAAPQVAIMSAEARALLFLSSLAVAHPALLGLRAADGGSLIDYGGLDGAPGEETLRLALRLVVPPMN